MKRAHGAKSVQCQTLDTLKMDHDTADNDNFNIIHCSIHPHSFSMHSPLPTPHSPSLYTSHTHTHTHSCTAGPVSCWQRGPPGCAFMNKFHFRVFHIPCAPAADIINLFIFHFLFHFHCCCCRCCCCRGAAAAAVVDPRPLSEAGFG